MTDHPTSSTPSAAGPPAETTHWRFIRRMFAGALILAGLFYLAWWTTLYVMQDAMIFPVDHLPQPSPRPRYPNTLIMQIKLAEGGTNEAWFVRGMGITRQHPGPVVVFFHGNVELIDYQDEIVSMYTRRGISVMLVEYRGYGRASGKPSQKAIQKDNEIFYDALLRLPLVDRTRIIFHGRSIGGAIAAQLARTRPPAGIILQSTFASMAQMARDRAAPGFLAKYPFDTINALKGKKFPMLIAHGTRDEVVLIHHAELFKQALPEATYLQYPIDHNSFPGQSNRADYWHQIDLFLQQLGIDTTLRHPSSHPTTQPASQSAIPQTRPKEKKMSGATSKTAPAPARSPHTQPISSKTRKLIKTNP